MSKAHDTNVCTCPSGDGSLRWPCHAHPPTAQAAPADPMAWPLPCDVTVGHVTMRQGVKLSTLVLRMKALYQMATGEDADVVAARTLEERSRMFATFQAQIAATPEIPATEYSSADDLAEAQAEPVADGEYLPLPMQYACAGPFPVYSAYQMREYADAHRKSATAPQAQPAFQQRVQPWMMACFGAEIAADRIERNHRFLEEALELVQATGCTQSEAHQLVDYVFSRPVGEPAQEVGGVMVTLAALCLANGLDMHQAGETELARVWTKVEAIRAKQAAKPKHSPLPQAQPADALTQAALDVLAERWRQVEAEGWTPERDDQYVHGDMASAAGCYAMFTQAYPKGDPHHSWPWDKAWWKPSKDARRNRVKACALLLAEIERLDRAAMAAAQEGSDAAQPDSKH